MVIERYRSRQSTEAAMPLTFSSPFGQLVSMAEGFRVAHLGRGFLFKVPRDAGNNTSANAHGSPGAVSPGTYCLRVPRPVVLAILPR